MGILCSSLLAGGEKVKSGGQWRGIRKLPVSLSRAARSCHYVFQRCRPTAWLRSFAPWLVLGISLYSLGSLFAYTFLLLTCSQHSPLHLWLLPVRLRIWRFFTALVYFFALQFHRMLLVLPDLVVLVLSVFVPSVVTCGSIRIILTLDG